MKGSYSADFFRSAATAVSLPLLILISIFYFSTRTAMIGRSEAELTNTARTLIPLFEQMLTTQSSEEFRSSLIQVSKAAELDIYILDETGTIKAASGRSGEIYGVLEKDGPVFQPVLSGEQILWHEGSSAEIRFLSLLKNRLRLYLKKEDLQLKSELSSINILFSVSALLLILFSVLWLMHLRRRFTNPIEKLIANALSFRRGASAQMLPAEGGGAAGELYNAYNEMIVRWQTDAAELTEEKEELDSLLRGTQEGVIAFDESGKIFLANGRGRSIFADHPMEGFHWWEAIREPEIYRAIEKALSDKKNAGFDAATSRGIFHASLSFLPLKKAFILVLHDITAARELEESRRRFISDVSHELRTPLTSIKGFVETLQSHDEPEARARFLEIIHRNTERLISLVGDLLILGEMEKKEFSLIKDSVSIQALIKDMLPLFEKDIAEKKLDLILDIDQSLEKVHADPFRFEQLFINLFSNAVKYTRSGRVGVRVSRLEKEWMLQISDSGVGIPAKDIKHIFDRFYRVDASRSRDAGGTGLGLAIVQEIVRHHGGRIEVQSVLGSGSVFTVTMPY